VGKAFTKVSIKKILGFKSLIFSEKAAAFLGWRCAEASEKKMINLYLGLAGAGCFHYNHKTHELRFLRNSVL
jgi:hypothetical protein